MGTALDGTLQARLRSPLPQFLATAELHFSGTESVSTTTAAATFERVAPSPSPPVTQQTSVMTPSLAEQVPTAIAKGMKIPIERVGLR
jgi:hypothetical protein